MNEPLTGRTLARRLVGGYVYRVPSVWSNSEARGSNEDQRKHGRNKARIIALQRKDHPIRHKPGLYEIGCLVVRVFDFPMSNISTDCLI